MSRHELITAIAIIALAIVAIVDSFKKSGWTLTGPDAGWYPFWSAAMMGVAAVFVLVAVARAKSKRLLFSSAEGARTFVQVAIPMLIGIFLLGPLGFYVISAAYMGYFARWVGGYRWHWVVLLAIGVPFVLYLTFENAFKVPLPKSLLYTRGVIPF